MRTEVFCGGRLIRYTHMVEVPEFHGEPFPDPESARRAKAEYLATHTVPVVPGAYWWEAHGQPITNDSARAMLAEAGEVCP